MRNLAVRAAPLILVSSIAACGGGGSDGGGPGIPGNPGGGTAVSITAANATDVVVVGASLSESFVQIALSALGNVFDLSEAGQPPAALVCSSGSGSATQQDAGGDGTLGDGDSVTLRYDACFQPSLGDNATGSIEVEIASLSIQPDGSAAGEVRISIPDELAFDASLDVDVEVSGSFDVAFTATRDLENLAITTAAGQSLQVVLTSAGSSLTEIADGVSIERTIDASGTYRISASLSLDSGLVNGTFDCATVEELVGVFNDFPDTGVFRCTGAGNSAARVVSVAALTARTEVDPEGDGTFVDAGIVQDGNGNWSDYLEGQLIASRLELPDPEPGNIRTIASTSLVVAANDAVYSSVTDRVYVANDAGVTVVDPQSMTVTDSVAIAGRPGPLAISDDGTTLWIGLQDVEEIVPVATADLAEGARVPLGASQSTVGERFAADVEVAPGSRNTVVVAMRGNQEVVAYEDGIALPDIIVDFNGPTHFEFRDATSIIGIDDSTSSIPALLMSIDGNGLSLDKSLRDFAGNGPLALGNGRAFVSFGRVFDVDAEVIVGRLDLDALQLSAVRGSLHVDRQAGIVYFHAHLDDLLDFYDAETLTPLGAYRLPTNGNPVTMLQTDGGRLLLVTESEMHAVDMALLEPTVTNRCRTTELNGQFDLDFFVQTDCLFNDAVYDAARDLVYASVPSAAGPDGNSVAVIDPRTGVIQSYIFVGSEPTRLSISGPGNRLYVALSEATLVAEVDLQSQALVSHIRLVPQAPVGFAQKPFAVAASPVSDRDVLVAKENEVALYSSGVQAPGLLDADLMLNLFYREDGSGAFGVDEFSDLWVIQVDATGLTQTSKLNDLLVPFGARSEGDLLFDRTGKVIEGETGAVVGICPVSEINALEPDPATDDVYYLDTAFESRLLVCDTASFTTGGPIVLPNFGAPGAEVKAVTLAGPDRLVITFGDRMLFLDPTEF